MPISYVDEVVTRYLMKDGYVITKGIWFSLPREKTGKKVSGWSDIDIFAVKPNKPSLIVQCKSFLGTESSEKIVRKILIWFEYAINFLKNDKFYKGWLSNNPQKILVVDHSVIKTEEKLKKYGIDIWHYEDKLKELLRHLKEKDDDYKEKGQRGKEEDTLLRIIADMIRRRMISKEIFNDKKLI